ncbi:acetylcholinesterase-like [Schistocerca americana]|uniref:acetylcholinesterase-like n=1 Tax=Schistocerca americana TaxID=7009 RepID=UPI001F4FAAF9|nr:acetylcholinesterase-like [Schistocerca americana]
MSGDGISYDQLGTAAGGCCGSCDQMDDEAGGAGVDQLEHLGKHCTYCDEEADKGGTLCGRCGGFSCEAGIGCGGEKPGATTSKQTLAHKYHIKQNNYHTHCYLLIYSVLDSANACTLSGVHRGHVLSFSKAPQPATSWSGVRDALSLADDCAQPKLQGAQPSTGSEDCLYLNVFVPTAASGSLPVMVHIHGGSFRTGSPSSGAPDYFVEKGVVMVSVAYRLGALGFLSLQNDDIPGNAGLKDQVLALQWIQRNIAAFGGDPSRVVVFGESAGGSSVSHLLLSPATKGLFSGVIMESGVATTPWALTDKPRERAYRMAEALGFQAQGGNHTDDDDARLAAFLRSVNYSDLATDDSVALSHFEKRCPVHLAFVPVVEPPSDSAVIIDPPADVLRAGSYNQVPIILGVTSGEGSVVYLSAGLLTEVGIADMKENFTALVGSQLPLPTEEQRTRAAQQLEQFYFGDDGFSTDDMQAVVDVSISKAFCCAKEY